MNKKDIAFGSAAAFLGIVLAVGAQTFAHPCVHADGSAAVCAPVKIWLTVMGGVITALAGVSFLRPHWVSPCLTAAAAILVILIPGCIVPVCRADTMRCRLVTCPTALVSGVLILAVSLWRLALTLNAKKRRAGS
ncbi:MAG: DUF4418 family protein [Clostridia bacterium]|nr:DUF4418 family protein [Clostridia bacterium]